jgi:hypothetical protein
MPLDQLQALLEPWTGPVPRRTQQLQWQALQALAAAPQQQQQQPQQPAARRAASRSRSPLFARQQEQQQPPQQQSQAQGSGVAAAPRPAVDIHLTPMSPLVRPVPAGTQHSKQQQQQQQ